MSAPSMRPDVAAAFAGRSVLVTGHTGFKGSWLSMWLDRLGARIHGFSLDPPTEPNLFAAAGVADLLVSETRADVRDLVALERAVEEAAPEVVFHLAAQPLVRQAFSGPAETFDVNVMGTVNVLEAVRRRRRPCVVIVVTTDKCYENLGGSEAFGEDDRLGGTEPYGASKAAAELVVAAYRHSYFPPAQVAGHGVRVASVRAGNVIGGGDWSDDRIVPDIIRSLAAGHRIQVRFPAAIRPWQHVVVPLSGYLYLAGLLLEGTVSPSVACAGWNFGPGPGDEVTVGQLVDDAVDLWGQGTWCHVADPLQVHEASVLRLDVSRAEERLGWTPAWDFKESLRHTLEWYRAWSDGLGFSAATWCLNDIRAYEAAAGWSTAGHPAAQPVRSG